MRITGVISLLLLIGYTQWGYDIQFIVLQWQMKEAAREAWIAGLPDRSFLRVSLAEIEAHGKWEETGKECWYQGHLYDVIRQRKEGSCTWLFCMDDDKEERLIRQSDQVTRANLDHPDKRSAHSLAFSIGDWVCEDPVWEIAAIFPAERQFVCGSVKQLPVCYTEILIPPPKG